MKETEKTPDKVSLSLLHPPPPTDLQSITELTLRKITENFTLAVGMCQSVSLTKYRVMDCFSVHRLHI